MPPSAAVVLATETALSSCLLAEVGGRFPADVARLHAEGPSECIGQSCHHTRLDAVVHPGGRVGTWKGGMHERSE